MCMISPEAMCRMLAKPFPRDVHLVVAEAAPALPVRLWLDDRIVEIGHVEKGALGLIKLEEAILENAGANLAHELVVEMEVVLSEELPAERLRAFGQMMEIRARVARAGRAGAVRIQLLLRAFVNAAAQLEKPARGESRAALRELRRHDAIEHVDAAMNGFEDIERRADAHEVARLVVRQQLRP